MGKLGDSVPGPSGLLLAARSSGRFEPGKGASTRLETRSKPSSAEVILKMGVYCRTGCSVSTEKPASGEGWFDGSLCPCASRVPEAGSAASFGGEPARGAHANQPHQTHAAATAPPIELVGRLSSRAHAPVAEQALAVPHRCQRFPLESCDAVVGPGCFECLAAEGIEAADFLAHDARNGRARCIKADRYPDEPSLVR